MSNPSIRKIQADNLPRPVGPYSPATGLDRLVFVSGQPGRDPLTGTDLQHVLRCGVFLADMAEFSKMNAVYERTFAGHKPARTTVQVAGLPGENLRVEIDCIAVLPEKA